MHKLEYKNITMKKQFYQSETFWTVFLGTLGCFALVWNFASNPNDWANILVNFAQIGVAVIVFFIANNIFRNLIKKKSLGFNEKFEEYLLDWGTANKYLIDTSEINVPKGNDKKRSIQMICKHSDMLKGNDASISSNRKGSFLYLPKREELGDKTQLEGTTIEFKINKSMFEANKEIYNDYENRKKVIADDIAKAIKIAFNELSITVEGKDDRIFINFSNLEKTEDNAKKLIDIVEFTKTLFLAVA